MTRDILYVDDEETNLIVFESAFEDDFNIHTATSAAEALEILEEHPIPVVVADQRMPEMTGVEMFAILRQKYPHTQRVILTGYAGIRQSCSRKDCCQTRRNLRVRSLPTRPSSLPERKHLRPPRRAPG